MRHILRETCGPRLLLGTGSVGHTPGVIGLCCTCQAREREKGWTNLFEELSQLRILVVGDDTPHARRELRVLREPHTHVNAAPGCSRGYTWSRSGLWAKETLAGEFSGGW